MRLLSRNTPVEELVDTDTDARPTTARTGVPLKAQKLLGEKGQLGLNIEESIIISGAGLRSGGLHLPPKAQRLLGEKGRVSNDRNRDSKHVDPESFWHIRDAEQKKAGRYEPPSTVDSDTIPGPKNGLPLPYASKAVPSSEYNLSSSAGSTVRTGTSTRYPAHQPSAESMSRDYYNAAKQPLNVSQQTSESSMRDRALRKGPPRLQDSPATSTSTTTSSPLYSAITARRMPDRSASDGPRTAKKIDLRSLLPHGKPYLRAASSGKPARSPADSTEGSEFFPPDTLHMQVARHGSRLLVESDKMSKPLPKRPIDGVPTRTRVFDDVVESQKKNIFRPPKGSKNWFDGFDISSDDEDDPEPEPVELPATELQTREPTAVQEGLPSVFSLYTSPTRDLTPPIHVNPVGSVSNTSPILQIKDVAKHQKRRKGSQGSTAADSASSGAVDGRKRSGESRLARSRLGAQSVLSISSASDDDSYRTSLANRDSVGNSTIINGKSASLDLQRPAFASFQLEQQHPIEWVAREGKLRRANSHSSSGPSSNPFRDTQTNYNSTPRIPSRSNGSLLSTDSSYVRRDLNGFQESPRYQPATEEGSYERDTGESGCDETTSSVPTDASRLMAVTEEEMMLLELMRQKRAAMQKHSFAEGYRLARRQEEKQQQYFAQDQSVTSDPALLVLKKRTGVRMGSRGQSRTTTAIREELEQRRRLSALRKEDVDKAFKMGRFLQMEHPNGLGSAASTERFFVVASDDAGDFAGRPISGTEIETDSRYDMAEDEMGQEMQSSFDEGEEYREEGEENVQALPQPNGRVVDISLSGAAPEQEARTPQPGPPALSSMQKLTNRVYVPEVGGLRGKGGSNDEQYAKLRAFLAKDPQPEDVNPASIPLPPSRDKAQETRQDQNSERSIPSAGGVPVAEPQVHGQRYSWTNRSSPWDSKPHQISTHDTTASESPQIDSPDSPVATTWARSTSLKHPRPQRQQPVLDFTPLELQPLRPRAQSSATSLSSPRSSRSDPKRHSLRATSPLEHLAEQHSTGRRMPEAGKPEANYTGSGATGLPQPLRSHPSSSAVGVNGEAALSRTNRAPPSPRLDAPPSMAKTVERVTSMESITSAGEDVLAAWAELGGGGGSEFRRKRNR